MNSLSLSSQNLADVFLMRFRCTQLIPILSLTISPSIKRRHPNPSPSHYFFHKHSITIKKQAGNQTPTKDTIHTPPSEIHSPIHSNPQLPYEDAKTSFPPFFIILHYEQLACAY